MCRGTIRPTDRSTRYYIEVRYRDGGSPQVRVLEPRIEYSAKIHMYKSGTFCLYDSRNQPWQSTYHLCDTILPWVAEWLVYYEIFLMTGKWIGNEAPHNGPKEEQKPSQ